MDAYPVGEAGQTGCSGDSFACMAIGIRVLWETQRLIRLGNEDKGWEVKFHIPAIVAVTWAHGFRDVLRMDLKSDLRLAFSSLAVLVLSVATIENCKSNMATRSCQGH